MGAIVPSRPSGVLAALDQFMREEFAKFGRMRPVVPPPTSARLLVIPFVCSHNGQPFTVTVGQDRDGEPYHVKSLEPSYACLLSACGYALDQPARLALRHGQIDWTGFQCFHCGVGRASGFFEDWFECGRHGGLICANRVEQIHGGGIKSYCPVCREWAMCNGEVGANEMLSGFHFDAHGPREAQAAPTPTFPTIQHTPASASVGSPLIGGYSTSLTIRPGGR